MATISTPISRQTSTKTSTRASGQATEPFFSEETWQLAQGSRAQSPGHALIRAIVATGELLSRAAEKIYGREIHLKWPLPLTIVRRPHYAGLCGVWNRKLRDEGSIV